MLKLSQKILRKVFLLCEYKEDANYSVKVCQTVQTVQICETTKDIWGLLSFCRNQNGIQYLEWLEMRYLFQIGDHSVRYICGRLYLQRMEKKGKGPVTFQPRIWSILELHYSQNHLAIIKLNCFLCYHDIFLSPAWNCVDHSLVQSVGQHCRGKLVWHKNWSHTKISVEENILKRLRTDIA